MLLDLIFIKATSYNTSCPLGGKNHIASAVTNYGELKPGAHAGIEGYGYAATAAGVQNFAVVRALVGAADSDARRGGRDIGRTGQRIGNPIATQRGGF